MQSRSMRRGASLLLAFSLLALATGRAEADTIYLSGAVNGNKGQLETYDTGTGAVATVGGTSSTQLNDISFTATGTTLYGVGGEDPSKLYTISTTTGMVSSGISTTAFFLNALGGIPNNNNNMYAAGTNSTGTSQFYSLSTTGTATLIGGLGGNFSSAGDIAYYNGTVYMTASDGAGNDFLVSVNTTTGAAMKVGTANLGSNEVFGLAAANNAAGVSTLYAFAGNDVYTVVASTGVATLIGNGVLDVDNNHFSVLGAASVSTVGPNAVPEPSSLVLCGLAGLMGLGYRRYRSKRNAA
jgi:hypothetical protein